VARCQLALQEQGHSQRRLLNCDARFDRPTAPSVLSVAQEKAPQAVGINEVVDGIWLVSFMDYDLGYFDLETRVLEPLENPFGPKVLPMS
jgi:putative transposase